MIPQLYTATELAPKLHISVKSATKVMNRWVHEGRIRATYVGRKMMFKEDDVLAFLKNETERRV